MSSIGQRRTKDEIEPESITLTPEIAKHNRRGEMVLSTLGRYIEALESCEKAIELGEKALCVFFHRRHEYHRLVPWLLSNTLLKEPAYAVWSPLPADVSPRPGWARA